MDLFSGQSSDWINANETRWFIINQLGPELITKMSKIAREELVHFEQVMRILKKRKIEFESTHDHTQPI